MSRYEYVGSGKVEVVRLPNDYHLPYQNVKEPKLHTHSVAPSKPNGGFSVSVVVVVTLITVVLMMLAWMFKKFKFISNFKNTKTMQDNSEISDAFVESQVSSLTVVKNSQDYFNVADRLVSIKNSFSRMEVGAENIDSIIGQVDEISSSLLNSSHIHEENLASQVAQCKIIADIQDIYNQVNPMREALLSIRYDNPTYYASSELKKALATPTIDNLMFAISLAEVCNLDSQEKRDAQRKLQDLRDAQQLGDNQSRAMIVEAVEDLRTMMSVASTEKSEAFTPLCSYVANFLSQNQSYLVQQNHWDQVKRDSLRDARSHLQIRELTGRLHHLESQQTISSKMKQIQSLMKTENEKLQERLMSRKQYRFVKAIGLLVVSCLMYFIVVTKCNNGSLKLKDLILERFRSLCSFLASDCPLLTSTPSPSSTASSEATIASFGAEFLDFTATLSPEMIFQPSSWSSLKHLPKKWNEGMGYMYSKFSQYSYQVHWNWLYDIMALDHVQCIVTIFLRTLIPSCVYWLFHRPWMHESFAHLALMSTLALAFQDVIFASLFSLQNFFCLQFVHVALFILANAIDSISLRYHQVSRMWFESSVLFKIGYVLLYFLATCLIAYWQDERISSRIFDLWADVNGPFSLISFVTDVVFLLSSEALDSFDSCNIKK